MIEIRQGKKDELSGLIPIYKEEFSRHGIFSKDAEAIMDYLENVDGRFMIAIDAVEHKVLGGLLVTIKEPDKGHTLARFKHIAVAEAHRGQGLAEGLFKEAEKMLDNAKIEIHVSENEKDALPFYERMGFEKEADLKDHYRMGERCYIMGKTLEREAEE